MNYFADLHIHSYYSRATSSQLNLEHLHSWGQMKGLRVIATGDITHPKWLAEMREKLVESAAGLYRLRDDARTTQREVPDACASDVHFVLSGEVSTIYKKDRVRKVHSVIFLPTFDAVEKLQKTLDRIGNIHSDGRPILGLDTRDLLEITLETDPRAQFIPAHIWTPWFSVFGSKSGFETLEECFEDLTPHIFALETGLSSDPPMNWRLSMLDAYTLVSNSDAHSPAKLAREANLFQTDLTYDALFNALKDKKSDAFWGTIEFFPQEGKYHMDGHRKCHSCTTPAETIKNNGLCPVCGKPAVLGVSYRIEELADRPPGYTPPDAKPFKSLIPLPEVLGEVLDVGPTSKRVEQLYHHLLQELGPELDILMKRSLSDIRSVGGDLVAEAISRMRDGKIEPIPGYDGEFGIIKIFKEGEREKILQQGSLFVRPDSNKVDTPNQATFEKQRRQKVQDVEREYGLNDEQRLAVEHRGTPLIVQAGPGTGKTRTLTHRLASLIETGDAQAHEILAFTFTNKAATEMRSRLEKLSGDDAKRMTIETYHAFGAAFLRQQESFFERDDKFQILSPIDSPVFRNELARASGEKISRSTLEKISFLKAQGHSPESAQEQMGERAKQLSAIFAHYERLLADQNAVDFDDLVNFPVRLLLQCPELRRALQARHPILAVDEFQDINKAQYELFRLLAITARDVCVIGDPDQAIYGFRGASAVYFNQFTHDFPQATSIRLKRNYRSAQSILSASLQMLGRNEEQHLWSAMSPEVKVHIEVSPTDRAEAEFVVHRIEQHLGGTTFFSLDSDRVDARGAAEEYGFSDFAILLRSRRLASPLMEALTRSGIPYQCIDDSASAPQVFAHFIAALLNPRRHNDAELFEEMKNHLSVADVHEFENALKELVEIDLPSIFDWLVKNSKQDEEIRFLKKTKELARAFGDNKDQFLDALMLQKQIDSLERADRVQVLTMHASKGLEFPVVFVIGCEDGIMPHYLPGQPLDVDEERRLLYVAMTRARRHLYLTRAKKRALFGKEQQQDPSRFLTAISAHLLQYEQRQYKRRKDNQLSLF
ncbi:UvrD-helicase domain-containing protein [candidate division KSB1 bacterium]|nr:UvrD-helicase domain-containing protein [candidate division KSB1 bacterium]RQW09991.1 MAG: hypothetical protein EH222_03135 [candidate division KSB1 bacterium]